MEQGIVSRYETVIQTVSVAVPRPVWTTYTYILPETMQGGEITGCRVIVPLGGSRVAGIVWNTDPHVSDQVKPKLKKVLERLDLKPLLPDSVFQLLKWASNYYCTPPGMMASAAFPPGMQGKAARMVRLKKGSSLFETAGSKPIEYQLLKSLVPESIQLDILLAEESSSDLAESWWQPEKLPSPRTVSVIEPLVDPAVLTKAGQSLKSRAPKQAEILACLAVMGPSLKSDLLKAAGAGRNSLERLRQLKLIKEVVRKVPRDPLLASQPLESKPVPNLNQMQREAVETILRNGKGTHLLHGVTGSGKTEVYLHLISSVLEQGKGAIVLVPEISLTPLAVSRFNSRFPGSVAVLHSGLSKGERLDAWNLVQKGERRIVIGPRSAVFAPVGYLGIIVVDEEHDGSYKQGSIPRYNARDLAVVRGSREEIPVVLGSASPSAESWLNALNGRYTLLTLPDRATGRELPKVTLVNSSGDKQNLLSDELLAAIGKRTAAGEQSIVLINRRGHSPFQMCFACGHVEKCPSCGISMTYHRKGEILRCHHCGKWKSAASMCPNCSGEQFTRHGPGIQKVEQILKQLLPATKVIRMDADTTRAKSSHWEIVEKFSKGQGDVLLGTQMVAKGHDFPQVTLAAVIAAEMGLYLPDFRAQETTFNLLLQISGRSGRSEKPGEVIIQTTDPENPVIKLACVHDYETFMKNELNQRRLLGFPPYSRMVRLIWSGENESKVKKATEHCCTARLTEGCRLLGPSEAALPRIADRWRYSALVTCMNHRGLSETVEAFRNKFSDLKAKNVRMDVDVDPRNLL